MLTFYFKLFILITGVLWGLTVAIGLIVNFISGIRKKKERLRIKTLVIDSLIKCTIAGIIMCFGIYSLGVIG